MRKLGLTAALFLVPGLAAQQPAATPAPPPPTIAVGAEAPDFTLPAVTAGQVSSKPLHLKDLRGQTVVLAFFPRARTGGCTIQMTAYRDRYAELFGGKRVVLLSISVDADTMLAAWQNEKSFTWTFLSDLGGTVGEKYGARREPRPGIVVDTRILYVIDPAGKVSTVMAPFREVDATSYTALADAIKRASATQ